MGSSSNIDLDLEADFEAELAKFPTADHNSEQIISDLLCEICKDAGAEDETDSDSDLESMLQLRAAYQKREQTFDEFGRDLEKARREIIAAKGADFPSKADCFTNASVKVTCELCQQTPSYGTEGAAPLPSETRGHGSSRCSTGAAPDTPLDAQKNIVSLPGPDFSGNAKPAAGADAAQLGLDAAGQEPTPWVRGESRGQEDYYESSLLSVPAERAVTLIFKSAAGPHIPLSQQQTQGVSRAETHAPDATLLLGIERLPTAVTSKTRAATAAVKLELAADKIEQQRRQEAEGEAEQERLIAQQPRLTAEAAAEQARLMAEEHRREAEAEAMRKRVEAMERAAAERAAVREAAAEAMRREAEKLARRYMAARCISRAWRSFRHGPAWAARCAAAVCLQAAWRARAGRHQAVWLRQRRDAMRFLEDAAKAGQPEVLQVAVKQAQALGLHDAATQRVAELQRAAGDAGARLRAAADNEPFSEFRAALAAAQAYPQLAAQVAEQTALFERRKTEAEAALWRAADEQPMAQFMRVLGSMGSLGLEAQTLRSALEAVRQRDAQVAAQLAEAAEAAAAGAPSRTGSRPFDAAVFEALAARAAQLGLKGDVAAARHVVEKIRRALATQLQRASIGAASRSAPLAELTCLAAEARRLGMRAEAEHLDKQALKQQQEMQVLLCRAAERGSAGLLVHLSQAALLLGVPAGELQAAHECLRRCRVGCERVLVTTATSGTIHTFLVARGAAARCGVALDSLVVADSALASRRRSAVWDLVTALRGLRGGHALLPPAAQLSTALASATGVGLPRYLLDRAAAGRVDAASATSRSVGAWRGTQGQQQQRWQPAASPEDLPSRGRCGRRPPHADSLCADRLPASMSASGCSHSSGAIGEQQGRDTGSGSGGASRSMGSGSGNGSRTVAAPADTFQAYWACSVSALQLGLLGNTCLALCALQLGMEVDTARGLTVFQERHIQRDCWGAPQLGAGHGDDSRALDAGGTRDHCADHGTHAGDLMAVRAVRGIRRDSLTTSPWPASWTFLALCPAVYASPKPVGDVAVAQSTAPDTPQARHATPRIPSVCSGSEDRSHIPLGNADCGAGPLTRAVILRNAPSIVPALSATVAAGATAPGDPGALVPLARIVRLDLCLERLSTLAGLDCMCPALRTLSADANELTSLEGLRGLFKLRTLSARKNRLTSCAQPGRPDQGSGSGLQAGGSGAASRLPAGGVLRFLALDSNHLTGELSGLASCSGLRSLSLGDNSLTDLGADLLACAAALTSLDVRANCLTGPLSGPCCALRALTSLRHLDVSGNRLTDLEGIQGLSLLQTLSASGNTLTALPQPLWLPLLTSLDLSRNSLSSFGGLGPARSSTAASTTTYAVGNASTISSAACASPSSSDSPCFSLGLGACRMQELVLLPSLERLLLQENQISRLGPLGPHPRLTQVDLSFNQLPSLEALRPLAALTVLLRLNVADNPATATDRAAGRAAGGIGGGGGGGHEGIERITARGRRPAGRSHQTASRAMVLAMLPSLQELDLDEVVEEGAGPLVAGAVHPAGTQPVPLPPLVGAMRAGGACGLLQRPPRVSQQGCERTTTSGIPGAGAGPGFALLGCPLSGTASGIARRPDSRSSCSGGGSGGGSRYRPVPRHAVGVSLRTALASNPRALQRALEGPQRATSSGCTLWPLDQGGSAVLPFPTEKRGTLPATAAAPTSAGRLLVPGVGEGAAGRAGVTPAGQHSTRRWAAAALWDLVELQRRSRRQLQWLDPTGRRDEKVGGGNPREPLGVRSCPVVPSATSAPFLSVPSVHQRPVSGVAGTNRSQAREPFLNSPVLRHLRPLSRAQTWFAARLAGAGAATAAGVEASCYASTGSQAARPLAEAVAAEVEARWDRQEADMWRQQLEELRSALARCQQAAVAGSRSPSTAAGFHAALPGSAGPSPEGQQQRDVPARLPLLVAQPSYFLHRMLGDAVQAAVATQAAWRGRWERRQLAAMRRQEDQVRLQASAVVIQSWWRGHRIRTGPELQRMRASAEALRAEALRVEAQRQVAAATKIQAHVRGHRVRKRLRAALAAARMPHRSAVAASGMDVFMMRGAGTVVGGCGGDNEPELLLGGGEGELEDLLAFLQPLDSLFQEDVGRPEQQWPPQQPVASTAPPASGSAWAATMFAGHGTDQTTHLRQAPARPLPAPVAAGGWCATSPAAAPPRLSSLQPLVDLREPRSLSASGTTEASHPQLAAAASGAPRPSLSSLLQPRPGAPNHTVAQGPGGIPDVRSSRGSWSPLAAPGQPKQSAVPCMHANLEATPPLGRPPLAELRIPGAEGLPNGEGDGGDDGSLEPWAGATTWQEGGADLWVNTPGEADGSFSSAPGAADHTTRAQGHMERLQRLMAEWGFKDLATAEAYYRRTRRQRQGQARRKRQDKYRDSEQRLQKLHHVMEARQGHSPGPASGGLARPTKDQGPASSQPPPPRPPAYLRTPRSADPAITVPAPAPAGVGGRHGGSEAVVAPRKLNSADGAPVTAAHPNNGASDLGREGRLPPLVQRSNSHSNAAVLSALRPMVFAAAGPPPSPPPLGAGGPVTRGVGAGGASVGVGGHLAAGGGWRCEVQGTYGTACVQGGAALLHPHRPDQSGPRVATWERGRGPAGHVALGEGGGRASAPQSPLLPPLANNWVKSPLRTPPT